MTTDDNSGRPFADSLIAKFLDQRIDELKGFKTQRQIATEAGYDKPNMISMFKRGDIKVPLDRIPSLAKALEVDPAHLFRLALEQYWPALNDTIHKIFGHIATKNEFKLLIKPWRELTCGADPEPNAQLQNRVAAMMEEVLKTS